MAVVSMRTSLVGSCISMLSPQLVFGGVREPLGGAAFLEEGEDCEDV